jgi:serine O-acetyltransferase
MWGADSDFRADLARYKRFDLFREPALWAIAVYRFGRWAATLPRPARTVAFAVYGVLHLGAEVASGVQIPKTAEIGGGLRILHFGGIVIHPSSRIGRNVSMGHGVTLGVRETDDAPVIEDDVVLSAYAQILGRVRVGRGAKVGAMSVVLHDVPPGAAVAGIPARVVGDRKRGDDPELR